MKMKLEMKVLESNYLISIQLVLSSVKKIIKSLIFAQIKRPKNKKTLLTLSCGKYKMKKREHGEDNSLKHACFTQVLTKKEIFNQSKELMDSFISLQLDGN